MTISLDPVVTPHVRAGVLAVDAVRVAASDPRLDEAMRQAEARLPHAPEPELATVVAAVRAMYRRFGVDPTRTRPSSEALLRRVRKGDGLPRVNTAVDLCNWCSVETQLPFGLYDRALVQGQVTLRVGREGEAYDGIRKDTVHLSGRLALADAIGPFGNPTSDSARTSVRLATCRLLFVIFAPRALPASLVEGALDLTAARVREYCGGIEVERAVA